MLSVVGAEPITFTWDGLGRTVSADNGSLVTYTYDGLSRVAARNASPFAYSGQWIDPTSDGMHTYGRSAAGRVVVDRGGSSRRYLP